MMGVTMTMSSNTRGVIFIHSAPKGMCSHIEWSLGGLLGATAQLEWIDQPIAPGTMRAELSWRGAIGLGAEIASILRAYPNIRFEVTEEPSSGCDGQRYVSTPTLGLWSSPMSAAGEIFIPEEKLRSVMQDAVSNGNSLVEAIDSVLGTAWDRELEPFRYAGDGMPVRWLHQVS